MHAYQPQRSPQRPPTQSPQRRRVRRHAPQRLAQQSRRNKAVLIELTLQMSVNCLLAGVAIATILRLLPYHLTQQEKLAELRGEVAKAELRVNQLRQDFSENFDAYDTSQLQQENSLKVAPNQKRVIWVEPDATATPN